MNCVLLVTAPDVLDPTVIAGAVAGVGAGFAVDTFDRYYECSARESTVAASMLTGVYERVHGVGAVQQGSVYPGPTLPGVLRERGFDCVAFGSVLPGWSFGVEELGRPDNGVDHVARPVAALDEWLVRRADGQRPFFALLWDRCPDGKKTSVAELLGILAGQDLLRDTMVVAVGTNAGARSELSAVFPPPAPLVVFRPDRPGARNHAGLVLDTVDLFPTIRALLVGGVAGVPVDWCCGVAIAAAGDSVVERGRVSVFSELVDDRLGIRASAVVGTRSRFAIFGFDAPSSGRRFTWSRLSSLVRGPLWRRRILLELMVRRSVERVAGIAGAATTGGMVTWGRREIKYWRATNAALAQEVRRTPGAEDDAALRARLRGLGYLG